jgi:hypothetical protein
MEFSFTLEGLISSIKSEAEEKLLVFCGLTLFRKYIRGYPHT